MGDNIALITLLVIFLVIGFIAPFIASAYKSNIGTVNTDGIISDAGNTDVTATTVVGSLFKVFFWTFGLLPAWMDALIMLPLRVWFGTLIYDKIRGI